MFQINLPYVTICVLPLDHCTGADRNAETTQPKNIPSYCTSTTSLPSTIFTGVPDLCCAYATVNRNEREVRWLAPCSALPKKKHHKACLAQPMWPNLTTAGMFIFRLNKWLGRKIHQSNAATTTYQTTATVIKMQPGGVQVPLVQNRRNNPSIR